MSRGLGDVYKRQNDDGQLTADLINRLIERIEISHEREINIFFRLDGKESRN